MKKTKPHDKGKVKPSIPPVLTKREQAVLVLIAEGMKNKEIGEKLDITTNTVKTHIKNIYKKFGINGRVQLVSRAKNLNIL